MSSYILIILTAIFGLIGLFVEKVTWGEYIIFCVLVVILKEIVTTGDNLK